MKYSLQYLCFKGNTYFQNLFLLLPPTDQCSNFHHWFHCDHERIGRPAAGSCDPDRKSGKFTLCQLRKDKESFRDNRCSPWQRLERVRKQEPAKIWHCATNFWCPSCVTGVHYTKFLGWCLFASTLRGSIPVVFLWRAFLIRVNLYMAIWRKLPWTYSCFEKGCPTEKH